MNKHEYITIEEYMSKAEEEAESDGDIMFLKTAGCVHPETIYNYLINMHPKYIEIRQKEDDVKDLLQKIADGLINGTIDLRTIEVAFEEYISECKEINKYGKKLLISHNANAGIVSQLFNAIALTVRAMKVAFKSDKFEGDGK